MVPPGNAKIRKAYVCVGSCGEKRSLEEKHYTHVDFQEFAKKEDKATSATWNCAMQMPEVEVGVARFSDLTSQANNEGELVYRRADWECLVHQRGALRLAVFLFLFAIHGRIDIPNRRGEVFQFSVAGGTPYLGRAQQDA
ncbi:hypothetical protein [Pseudomonas aeruginosa]|uniref:hypothetical protein n=1 Tax=Pseudomonas aeruginosa TaxID=287 RepID=UPI00163CBF57|nr:hypothetical protein [Pseudomonas aeruginosa]MEB6161859.1 hypothetical protein [Pseudomonas aeruginosa]HDQ4735655.1 hypothetical protein [Pseudomonas aeruginosa]